jgi:leucyl-tRNA synthetase
MKFNTAIAAMMTLVNKIYDIGSINRAEYKSFLTILNPFAPHMTEEIYNNIFGKILNEQKWVEYDEALCVDSTVEIAVQINGKIKARVELAAGLDKSATEEAVLANDSIKPLLDGKNVVKVIAVPGKLVNIVVK